MTTIRRGLGTFLVAISSFVIVGCAQPSRPAPEAPTVARSPSTAPRTPLDLATAPTLTRPLSEEHGIADIAELVDRNIIFGIPRTQSPVTQLWNVGYTVGYSEETRTPLWVSYRLFADPQFDSGPRPSRFIRDDRVADAVVHDDYNNTGYDRGHLAPNAPIARRYGDDAQRATFLTTNIMPQLPGLNQRGWEALEGVISTDWAERFSEVWVFVGPIFEGECWEFETDVRIPSHCYMIIVDIDDSSGDARALGIVMEQRRVNAEPLKDFVVAIDEIESRTGIDFLHDLEDAKETALEASEPDELWEINQILSPQFPGIARPIVRRRCD